MTYGEMLNKLSKSKFRNSFHLKEKDIIYIKEKGFNIVPVSDLIYKENYKIDANGIQKKIENNM